MQKGPKLPIPSAIHLVRDFNQLIGMDGVEWKNTKGKSFKFIHLYDEGSGFHLGKEVQTENAVEAIKTYKEVWHRWAEDCDEIYVDPHGSYVSDQFQALAQEGAIKLKVTASDSHWQLGPK